LTTRKHPVAGEDVGEAAAEQAGEKTGEQPVSEHMPASIGLFLLVLAGADDHVELIGEQQVDHRRRRLRIIGQIAVRHDIDIGVDVGEHPPDDMTLALLALGTDDRACLRGDLPSPVAAVVVVDVDRGRRQRLAEARDSRADRRFLVEAGQKHRDARLLITIQADPLG
jgi:hypothetical protein